MNQKMIPKQVAQEAIDDIMEAWERAVDESADPELADKIKQAASANILAKMLKALMAADPFGNIGRDSF